MPWMQWRHKNVALLLSTVQNGGNNIEFWVSLETNFVTKTCTLEDETSLSDWTYINVRLILLVSTKKYYVVWSDLLLLCSFENLRWLWTPCTYFFLNFAKSCVLSCLSNISNKKKFTVPFLKYKLWKVKLRVFLAGHSVAMVTYCVTKSIPTCSPMIGQFFDTMIVAWIFTNIHEPEANNCFSIITQVIIEIPKQRSIKFYRNRC